MKYIVKISVLIVICILLGNCKEANKSKTELSVLMARLHDKKKSRRLDAGFSEQTKWVYYHGVVEKAIIELSAKYNMA